MRDCQDLQHTIFLQTFDGRLHVSELEEKPLRVLDAGCGTGIWSIEFGAVLPDPKTPAIQDSN